MGAVSHSTKGALVAESGYVHQHESFGVATLPLMESALLSTAAKSLVQIEIASQPLIP